MGGSLVGTLGDRAAARELSFTDFYTAEFAPVVRAALAFCGDREIALDSTQEAFARAYARWRRLRGEAWAGGWVMTTALNLCRKALRKTPPMRAIGEPVVDEPAADRVDLVRVIRRLPLRQRQAVVLFYVGDLPVERIAHLMGISEGGVKANLSKARASLRKVIESEPATTDPT